MRPSGLAVPALLAALATAACGGDGEPAAVEQTTRAIVPPRYSATVDHPLVPLSTVGLTVFEGRERDPDTGETIRLRVESRVLDRTDHVGGIPVAVVEVKESENGELVERTLDYYAQRRDGSVWYLGERVDDYEDGKVVGHQGQWLAGQDGAQPGLFMPGRPEVGRTFEQERAPGVAEDRSTVVAVGLDVRTPAGAFSDCIRTRDFAPLDDVTEFKLYCRGIGLVREEPPGGRLELIRYR